MSASNPLQFPAVFYSAHVEFQNIDSSNIHQPQFVIIR